tara:strand:+ start:1634 stop:2542 length:909 start_codon:yes stop_codon:yes gene_type:complete
LETWYTVERKNALEGLKTGNLQISTSCGVLTEGFDEPSISCIIMARPTRFKGLYIQCVGRGLRLHPSKEDCLVLDFADEGHNLETTISFSKAIPEVQEKKNQESQEEKGKRNHQLHITRNCDEEFDLIGTAKFIWVSIGDGEWSLEDDNRNEIIISPKETGYVAQVLWKEGGKNWVVENPIPLEYCFGCCEDFARKRFKLDFASTDSPWVKRRDQATTGQVTTLSKKGISAENLSKSEASIKIREVFAKERKSRRNMQTTPATEKQISFLRRIGISTTEDMSKLEAKRTIADWRKNKKPVKT